MTSTMTTQGFRLAPQQKRLWHLQQVRPSPGYEAFARLRLEGPLDSQALRRALSQVVERHEILRTEIRRLKGIKGAVQVIEDTLEPTWIEEDVRDRDAEHQERAVLDLRRRLSEHENVAPLRVALLRLAPSRSLLLLVLSAQVADRAALARLAGEIAQAYGGGGFDEEAMQYADLAEWQNDLLEGEETAAGRAWWQERTWPETARLPYERRPVDAGFLPESVGLRLGAETTRALRGVAEARSATLGEAVFACWQVLLGQLTERSEMTLGWLSDGRKYRELQESLGPFERTLPVRAWPERPTSFSALVEEVRDELAEARQREEYLDFDRVLAPEDEPGTAELPLGFAWYEPAAALPAGEIAVSPERLEATGDVFALRLAATPAGDDVDAELCYDATRFERRDVEVLAEQLETLATVVAAAPDEPSGRHSLIGERQRRLFARWNDTALELPPEPLVHEWIEERAARAADAVAVDAEDRTLTYQTLMARATGLGEALWRLGARPERWVAILAERSAATLTAMLGVLRSGAAYVPLDPGLPERRLRKMVAGAGASLLVGPPPLVRAWAGGEETHELGNGLEALVLHPYTAASETPAPVLRSKNLAYAIYTSGSSGEPKAVMVTHRALCNRLLWSQERTPLNERDGVLQLAALGFDFSLWELFAPLLAGARTSLPPARPLDVAEIVHLIGSRRATVVHFVPSLLGLFLEHLGHEPPQGSGLRLVFSGGEALSSDLERRFFERFAPGSAELHNQYGPTEATIDVTHWPCRRSSSRYLVPIGRPIANCESFVLDPRMESLGVGLAGELHVGGEGLARGYLGRPALTSERFVPHPVSRQAGRRLYKTGDLVRLDGDGQLDFLGRVDRQVQVRGIRVELGEIEATLTRHPEVREAAVRTHGEQNRVVAYAVAAVSEAPETARLAAFLRERLPLTMLPETIVLLDALPRGAAGKVDHAALPEPSRASTRPRVALSTPTEVKLAGIWTDVLDVGEVGADDDFFELGGHSLVAMRLLSRIRTTFDADIPLSLIFESATLAKLAGEIDLAEGGAEEARPLVAVSRDQPLPLSPIQQQLWYIQVLHPESKLYNISYGLMMNGSLAVGALMASLNEVVARHEVFRTRFFEREGQPRQSVDATASTDLPLVDLGNLAGRRQYDELRRQVLKGQAEPFDLGRGELLRRRLFRLGGERHALHLTTHHIVFDGWSIGVFSRELARLYNALVEGRGVALPELPIQYADYASWQHGLLTGGQLAKQFEYWREQLSGIAPLEMPTDRPRPAVSAEHGALVHLDFGEPLTAALERLEVRGVTRFMVLAAITQELFHRFTGQRDVLLGFPTARRTRPEIEGLIGFFINTLILRADLEGQPSFRELLGRVRRTTLEAHENQDLPFEKLVAEVHPERDPTQPPLVQVLFGFQNAPVDHPTLTGLELSMLVPESDNAKFDLTIAFEMRREELTLAFLYDVELFDETTVRRLVTQTHQLFEQASANPDAPLAALGHLPDAARQQVHTEWNDTRSAYPRDRAIVALFEEQAAQRPEAVAVACGSATPSPRGDRGVRALSYGQLDRRANALSHRLREMGVGPEVPVALDFERSLEMVVAVVGVLKAGGWYLPLDPQAPAERRAFVLSDAAAKVLLRAPAGSGTAAAGLPILEIDAGLGADTAAPVGPSRPENLVYGVYTSGSTGRPKGVGATHQAVARLIRDNDFAGLGADQVWLHMAPLAFDASTLEIWGPLANGGRLVLMPPGRLELQELGEVLRRERISSIFLTTGLFHLVVDQRLEELADLRQLMAGGDVLSPGHMERVRQRWPRLRLIAAYGPTENTTFTTCHGVAEAELTGPVPIGRPIRGGTVHVTSWEMLAQPPGVVGELCTGGDGLARGYLGRPGRTAVAFVPNPLSGVGTRLYRTGDLARWQTGGTLDFLGRADFQVKIRGFRIELAEIAAVIRRHPNVAEAVVTAPEAQGGDRRLIAYVVAAAEAPPDTAELRDHAATHLPEYMVPSTWVALERMPLTDSGKIDRAALPGPESLAPASPPAEERRGWVCEMLAELWAEVLGLESIGLDDNFFEYGGQSLLANMVVSRSRRAFGVSLRINAIFENQTVRQMAALIEKKLLDERFSEAEPITGSAEPGPAPLSFAQERMWFLQNLAPDDPRFNVTGAAHIHGRLEVESLTAAFGEVRRRHAILRSRFRLEQGRPVQVIQSAAGGCLDIVALDRLPLRRAREHGRAECERIAKHPLTLEGGPGWRALLFRLDAAEHLLLVVMHHILTDGWSVGVLLREMARLYNAALNRAPSPLAELEVQYRDFARWQRRWLTGPVLEQQIAYWKEQLRGAGGVLGLPTDQPRPAVLGSRACHQDARLDKSASGELRALARKSGATAFMALLAGFNVFLHRYTAETDLVVGSPVAGRDRDEIEGLIGLFVNTLAMRADLSGNPSFADLLAQIRQTTFDAFAHQDLPLERLIDELAIDRDLSRNPLFQALFAVQDVVGEPGRWENLSLAPVDLGEPRVHVDLSLTFTETPRGWSASLLMCRDLFDPTTVRRMARHLRTLLAAAIRDPDEPVAALAMLAAGERHQLLNEHNDKDRPLPEANDVGQWIDRQVELHADSVAVDGVGTLLSYGELGRRAEDLGGWLRSRGVGPEALVVVASRRRPEMVVMITAVLKAGGVYVPVDPDYPRERIAFLLEDLGCSLPHGTRAPLILTCGADAGLFSASTAEVVDLGSVPYETSSARRTSPSGVTARNLAYVIYTSGSTGRPKGVQITHGGLANTMAETARIFECGPGSRVPQLASLSFDASVFEIFSALTSGATLVLLPRDTAVSGRPLAEAFRTRRVTGTLIIPSLLETVPAEEINSLSMLLVGGEVCSAELVRRWAPGRTMLNLYGPTEVTIYATAYRSSEHEASAPAVGRPITNSRCYALGPSFEPLPLAIPGEMFLGGRGLARGYRNQPGRTAERFVPDPFGSTPGERVYRTGDLLRHRAGGELDFLGRIDRQVKVRGFRIELAEIETAIGRHPRVRHAVVLAREDRPGRRRLVAYVVPEGELVAAELRRALERWLPDYMVPSAFVILDQIPLTPNHKFDRAALPAPEELRKASGELKHVAARNTLEMRLEQIWLELLELDIVSVDDDFFELGGSSLLVVQLMGRVKDQLGIDVSLTRFYARPTLESLASLVASEARPGSGAPELVAIRRDGDRPPFFCVHSLTGDTLPYSKLARHLGPEYPVYAFQGPHLSEVGQAPPIEELARRYLSRVREVHAAGPYCLGGYSFGSIVAFEMARQLHEEGEEVALLALIDGASPEVLRKAPDRAESLTFAGLARDMAREAGLTLDLSHEELKAQPAADRLGYILAKLTGSGLLPPDIEPAWIRRFLQGIREWVASIRTYHPQSYAGPITFFRSSLLEPESAKAWLQDGIDLSEDTKGWKDLANQPIDVRRVPGYHATLFREPNVRTLAQEIRTCLDEAASRA